MTVTTDTTTTVDDQLPVPGSISVTATDSVTQAPVQSFCVFVGAVSANVCTDNGTALIPKALPANYVVEVDTNDAPFLNAEQRGVTVTSGQTTAVNVTLVDPAAVQTTITDAKTGAPVANACLHLVDVRFPFSLGQSGPCTGPDGTIANSFPPGTYKAFVAIHDGVAFGIELARALREFERT